MIRRSFVNQVSFENSRLFLLGLIATVAIAAPAGVAILLHGLLRAARLT